jgi:transcriptional regulator with XRE-family HTH domain
MNSESEKIRDILSKNIKARRKNMGISQEKLAELADLSAQTINDIEGRRMWVSDKTIAKLCHALNIEAFQLLIPQKREQDRTVSSPQELIVNLRQTVLEYIDLKFEEVLKSGNI